VANASPLGKNLKEQLSSILGHVGILKKPGLTEQR
jgi:hypothetical protein